MLYPTCLTKRGRATAKAIQNMNDIDLSLIQSIKRYSAGTSDILYFIDSYQRKGVKTIRLAETTAPPHEPILLCAVKDDLERVKAQIEYHKKIGVQHFAYIDNMSTDGTYEWLRQQNDVSLFVVEEAYSAAKRTAWRKQVMDILGYDRWYLVLDSDEFFCYPAIEHVPITHYVEYLESKGLGSAHAPLIDMYSKEALFSTSEKEDKDRSFFDAYCYFDTDTYLSYALYRKRGVQGGPRARLFPASIISISKYPLVKARAATISSCHRNYPLQEQKWATAFLLHYKFLPSDVHKCMDIIRSGNYYLGSHNYKQYMEAYEQNPNLTFYYEGSQKFNSSMDLLKINLCDRQFFKDFFTAYKEV